MEPHVLRLVFHREERPSVHNLILFMCLFTCIVAQTLPLFSPPVQPGTEAHQDDPAGPSQTSDECRLLHHIRDAVVALWARHYVRQLRAWGCHARADAKQERNKWHDPDLFTHHVDVNVMIQKINCNSWAIKTCLKKGRQTSWQTCTWWWFVLNFQGKWLTENNK